MITLFRANEAVALKDLKSTMKAHIRKLPQQISPIGEVKTILRFELPCEAINILSWLHNNQIEGDKIYFSDRSGSFEMGGIGVCDMITGDGAPNIQATFEYMQDHLSADNPELRYYGGMNFDLKAAGKGWEQLGSYRFMVPQFELYNTDGKSFFAFNIAIADISDEWIEETIATLEQINFTNTTQYRKAPRVISRLDTPDIERWRKIFQSLFKNSKLIFDKIVLARQTDFTFDTNIRPIALIKHLKDMSPNCFHFCIQPSAHNGFLGASPERLFKKSAGHITSEALAGTAKRGSTAQEDYKLAQDLLLSEKNRKEHTFVVDDLREKLNRLCADLTQDKKPDLVKFDSSQHLRTSFEGTLQPAIEDHTILETLHPTAAVAGCPQAEVLAAIEKMEPFSRGWYAGPVGYVGYNESEFAVAIRSGLVQGNKLSLFAGAGIVEGSTADEEWDEIENKISSFIKVFNR